MTSPPGSAETNSGAISITPAGTAPSAAGPAEYLGAAVGQTRQPLRPGDVVWIAPRPDPKFYRSQKLWDTLKL